MTHVHLDGFPDNDLHDEEVTDLLTKDKEYIRVGCQGVPLEKKKVADRYAGVVRCDWENCTLPGADHIIPEGRYWFACTSCHEYDLWATCYEMN